MVRYKVHGLLIEELAQSFNDLLLLAEGSYDAGTSQALIEITLHHALVLDFHFLTLYLVVNVTWYNVTEQGDNDAKSQQSLDKADLGH